MIRSRLFISAALLALACGCENDRPHDYGQQRPPLDQLDPRDRGLQSKDVLVASDKMAMDLLGLPELNQSRNQWTVVVMPVEDRTIDRRGRVNYDVFIERLRTNLAKEGHGRIALIENRARFEHLRDQELDNERDPYGQGGGERPAPRALQPDYALYGKALDMPNRGTDYYQIQFDLVNLNTKEQVWTNAYEVRVARK